MTVVLIIVGVLILIAFAGAAGLFNSRRTTRRTHVVEREAPVRERVVEREVPVREQVVERERRIVD